MPLERVVSRGCLNLKGRRDNNPAAWFRRNTHHRFDPIMSDIDALTIFYPDVVLIGYSVLVKVATFNHYACILL